MTPCLLETHPPSLLILFSMDSRNSNPPCMRVLTRPPTPTPTPAPGPTSASSSSPDPQPSSQSHPRSLEGVVVVGFLSRSPDHSTHLINRILDSNAFGSGHLDKTLFVDKEEIKDWFKKRKISYYHEEEKGLLFLQFCSIRCPIIHGFSNSGLEELEFEELQGLLFMFSFRVLQASKHALTPYVRSRTIPPLSSRPHSSLSSSRLASSTGSSPVRSGSFTSRNSSAVSIMSGLGSYVSLFPGYCTPVMLFVFVDDFLDVLNSSSSVEESTDSSSFNQSSGLSSVARSNAPAKGSGSVVVLARPVSKSEGGFRKKLQSSLEAQIRFLIKKCRTLSGSESGHTGSRSGAVSSSAPLFSLDASRSVVLLDRSANLRGESLEFATDLVEDILNGKATSDSLLLERHSQNANKEDILSIKEFIYRQSDILRGKGGLVTGTNSGFRSWCWHGCSCCSCSCSFSFSWVWKDIDYSLNFQVWKYALPTAKNEYLKDLPACYATAQHEAHLEKALRAFMSMFDGETVHAPEDTMLITGEPHNDAAAKPHSSGYFYLHACACGRSRQLLSDPFDFESANVSSNCFTDCDKLLPAIQLPEGSNIGPIQSSSWSLIRVAGTRYYEPSKGLLQSGFSSTHKFLSKWTIFLEKPTNLNGLPASNLLQGSVIRSSSDPQGEFNGDIDRKKTVFYSADMETGVEKSKKTFTGSSATDSGFPPLQQRKQHPSISEKDMSPVQETLNGMAFNGGLDGDPFLRIGSNVVPVNINGGEVVKSSKHSIVYVGFEHECPHGHRFLLSLDHLNELGPLYSLPEESRVPSVETSDNSLLDPSNLGRNSGTGKEQKQTSLNAATRPNFMKCLEADFLSISLDDGGSAFSILNRNLPIYMNCPYCQLSKNKKDPPKVKFAGTLSQLQRIFLVTPPFPVVLASCPVIQFAASCLPPSVSDREQKLQFSLGCQVVLPPESFLTLKLPFVYGVQLVDGNPVPLNAFECQPEMTAWIMRGTALQVVSKASKLREGHQK
ncbi:hypothetical protein NC653_022335 [Populus alba x Populus x berolinensis]|uniref:Nonsense-mediated mRNA decay factor SMG8 n=1 Tax=Populus alba x Populus x berolinensis TaxID=444605 RepID=A0AAD6MEK1_9ROSI|nr:hypothetical protein NC653_022335 [Populus alba x Populus x berolinensis]